MVAAASTAFFSVSTVCDSSARPAKNVGGCPASIDARGIGPKSVSSKTLQVKVNAQAPPKVNGSRVGLLEGVKSDNDVSCLSPPRNQLPDWSMLLAAITTIFLAAEKQWTTLDWKPKRPDLLDGSFGLGQMVNGGLVFRQNFSIRSYEIGADRTASVETLMNHLQESALNHLKQVGLLGDGFGSTPEMCKRKLIWVVTRMQVMVDRYPTWGDVVQVDTWVAASGKNGVRRDWLLRDYNTGEILTRASSCYAMMNKQTRKLSKLPDEVRGEITNSFVDAPTALDEDRRESPKLTYSNADYIHPGLVPTWGDLDVNQHVNNVKYVGWILKSTPQHIVESHELASMTLEYKKECVRNNVLDSLTSILGNGAGGKVECQHLLRLKDGPDVMRGRTLWRPKRANGYGSLGQLPT